MNQKSGPEDSLVLSYLSLRKAVGIVGVMLPFVLALGKIFSGGEGVEPSISHYYYTNMVDVFVGSLSAIGVFLLSTKGYDGRDQAAGIFASTCAIGVALLPTDPVKGELTAVGAAHNTCAALLFATLSYFCIKLFTQTDGKVSRQKLWRNKVYRTCGYTILACIGLIGVAVLPPVHARVDRLNPRFWLESIAIIAFGFAWLTKGEAILKDEEAETHRKEKAGKVAAGR
jgi:hypothetical protein